MVAKSSGDIFDQLVSESSSNGDIFDQLISEQPSKARSVAGAAPKGILKGGKYIPSYLRTGPIPQELVEKVAEQVLPTRPEATEDILERAGKLLPLTIGGPEGLALKAAEIGLGTLAGELAKESGLGETGQEISELAGMSLPGLTQAAIQKVTPLAKKGLEKAISQIKAPVEKLPSGLTKPKAVEAKYPGFGTLSKERQAKVLTQLDKEASELTKKAVEKHQPITKQVREGFDFEGQYEKDFGQVKQLADKANPDIDIEPISKMMQTEAKNYRGIPKLHPEASKIVNEIKAFRIRPPTSLKNLLKTYRSNNKKIKNIYETSRINGKQQEYVDFLVNYNKSIADSFRKTLPKDSVWLNMFEQTNKNYKNFKDAQKTLSRLGDIFGENPTLQKVEKLSNDIKSQKLLQLSMGEKGAGEIIQIGKDLKLAKDSIKKIPSKEISKWDQAFPLYFFIPWVGKILGIAKAFKVARYGYGWLLSTPARRASAHEALQAISKGNLKDYEKATKSLKNELGGQKLLTFQPSKEV